MSKIRKLNRTSQHIKEEQINFLLEDIEKNLEQYKKSLDLKEKQLSDTKKSLFLPKIATIKQLLKTKN